MLASPFSSTTLGEGLALPEEAVPSSTLPGDNPSG